jgi:hypothetical protein
MSSMPNCLRCDNAILFASNLSENIEFFECPQCHRHYARKSGQALTFRWGHPTSLPLYTILFTRDPLFRVSEIGDLFIKDNSLDFLQLMTDEIELELQHPTQQIRDILDNPQAESECREFLAAFANYLRAHIKKAD